MFGKNKASNLLNKYKESSVQVKAALWYTICNIIQKSLSFLVTPIFSRIMSKNDYGLYTIYNSWYWIVAVFGTLNLYCGIFNNGMQEYKETRDQYISELQSLSSVATLVCFFLYLPFRKIVEQETGLNFLLCSMMFLQVLFTPALYYWQGRQRYEYKYRRMIVITLLIAVLRPFISALVVLASSNKGLARVISFVMFEIIVGVIFYIHNIVKGRTFYNHDVWKSALLFAFPLIPHYLSQTFLSQLDKLMIDRFSGRNYVAIYEIGYTVAMIGTFINTSINNAIIPWVYDHLEKKKFKEIPSTVSRLLIIVGSINLFVILFSKEIVYILGGKIYSDSVYIVPVLCWSVFFMFLYSLFGNIEFYYKKTIYTMYGSLFACLLNGILNFIFIRKFGYQAAAYTTLVSYACLALFHFIFVKKIEKKVKAEKLFDYKFMLILSIVGTAICVFSKILYYNDIVRYTIILVAIFTIILFRKKIIPHIKWILNIQ